MRLARVEAERLAKEEVERLEREEAVRLAKEEAQRVAREEAERLPKEENKMRSELPEKKPEFGQTRHGKIGKRGSRASCKRRS